MSFNVDKCKVLSITRSVSPLLSTYCMDSSILEHVGNFKDLGIVIDCKLSFRDHICALTSKANSLSAMIKRTVGYYAPYNVTLQLYNSLIRSTVEYSSSVWSPYLNCDIKKLESIQRSMTKYILGYPEDVSYKDRCTMLNILPLSYRRECHDLVCMFKIINKLYDSVLPENIELVPVNSGLRSSNQGILLRNQRVLTDKFQNSYFNRIVKLWNNLPKEIRDSNDLTFFKQHVKILYQNKLKECFDVDNLGSWTSLL